MAAPEASVLKLFSQRTQAVAVVLLGLGGFAAAVIGSAGLAQHYAQRQVRIVVQPLIEQSNAVHVAEYDRLEVLETQASMQTALLAELLEQLQLLRDVTHQPRLDYSALRERVRRTAEFDRKVNSGVPAPPGRPAPAIKLAPQE